ncbi:MAG: tetratricopeptide repeat protein [Planctomycetota bacterium]|nr:tetratricopeptide repeat protein [Planctomycetota bacterium]
MHRILILAAVAAGSLAMGCSPGNQRDAHAAFDEGFAAFQAGHWQRAYDGFTRYLRSGPEVASRGEVYYYRGEALVHLRRRDEAMADFKQALASKPGQPILDFVRVAIGNFYYEEGNDAKALEWYDQALRDRVPELPMDQLSLRAGVSLQRVGRWQDADKYFQHLINNFPATVAAQEARRRIHATAFAVQTGAFTTAAAAQQELARLRQKGFDGRIVPASRPGQTLQAVQVGRARTYAEAQALASRLMGAGFSTLIVP